MFVRYRTSMSQKTGLKRNTIDKYYTKPEIVDICINAIKIHLFTNDIEKNSLIIEPSAGNGAFISHIKELSKNYKFYDITPDNSEIIKQDFLELDHQLLIETYKIIHIIGNPPFGRQSSTAIKFIKKCCLFAATISFILPKSFKKESMRKRFHENFHLLYEIDLPENSFLVNDIESDVPCVFQIWQEKMKHVSLLRKNTLIILNSFR